MPQPTDDTAQPSSPALVFMYTVHAVLPLHSITQFNKHLICNTKFKKSIPEELIPATMSATKWIVATSVGAVEALKDQGFCRWNHAFRSIHHNARNSMIGSLSQAKNKLPSSARDDQSAPVIVPLSNGRLQESEESLKQVMLLSSWVPS